MSSIKFEIVAKHLDVPKVQGRDIVEGCTSEKGDSEVLESFEFKDDAIKALKNYRTEVARVHECMIKGVIYMVTEYYAMENVYDDAGKCVDSTVLGITGLHINVVDESNNTVIGSYDNYGDAIDRYFSYRYNAGRERAIALKFIG